MKCLVSSGNVCFEESPVNTSEATTHLLKAISTILSTNPVTIFITHSNQQIVNYYYFINDREDLPHRRMESLKEFVDHLALNEPLVVLLHHESLCRNTEFCKMIKSFYNGFNNVLIWFSICETRFCYWCTSLLRPRIISYSVRDISFSVWKSCHSSHSCTMDVCLEDLCGLNGSNVSA